MVGSSDADGDRGRAEASFVSDDFWHERWAFACAHLGLSRADFGECTEREWAYLTREWQSREAARDYQTARVATAFGGGDPQKCMIYPFPKVTLSPEEELAHLEREFLGD